MAIRTASRRIINLVFILVFCVLILTPREVGLADPTGDIYYVDKSVDPAGDGSSWENAFRFLYQALSAASNGDQIWVLEGTYYPDDSVGRYCTFALKNGVEIYGGFPRGGSDMDGRDPWSYPTTLSGDVGSGDDNSDNCYHVVTSGSTVSSSTILDGFTIIGGNADGSASESSGGGLFNTVGSPTLQNLVFRRNHAYSYGGGIENNRGNPKLLNVIFEGNTAGTAGGGMDNFQSSGVSLINVLFAGNSAPRGGGLNNDTTVVKVTNATFSGNAATSATTPFGAGVFNLGGEHPVFTNTILWGNTPGQYQFHNEGSASATIHDSLVQGGCPVGANCQDLLTSDPKFFQEPDSGEDGNWGTDDDDYGDLRLQEGSPAINAGDNASISGTDTDLMGNPRIMNGPDTSRLQPQGYVAVDLGAYETPPEQLYVDQDAEGTNSGGSWDDAFTDLQTAVKMGRSGATEIWVANGEYKPGDTRSSTFELFGGVELYGCFPSGGGDGSFSARDTSDCDTTLSGGIGSTFTREDNIIHIVSVIDQDGPVVVDGFRIAWGYASGTGLGSYDYFGGGLFCHKGEPTVKNVTFYENYAAMYGGSVYNDHCNSTLEKVLFLRNEAPSAGGGMYSLRSSLTVVDATFEENTTLVSGGGMYNSHSWGSVVSSIFIKNTALDGGGVYNKSSLLSVFRVSFIRNEASNAGGGISNDEGNPEILSALFQGNKALLDGGGMYNYRSDPWVGNTIFAGNQAKTGGGMYSFSASNPILVNVTFAGNHADQGGGMDYAKSTSTVANTIFWGNTATASPSIAPPDMDSSLNLQYSLLPGGCPSGASCAGLIDSDPKFIREPSRGTDGEWGTDDDDYGDLRVERDSPVIDAGDNSAAATLSVDLVGNPRLVDVPEVADTGNGTAPFVDMGAYETPPAQLYVDHTATGEGTGLSWTDAFTAAYQAFNWGQSGPLDIWIAQGTYAPGDSRDDTFYLSNGVEVYGGFPNGGGEGTFAARDWEAYPTILSGEIGATEIISDNVYHVVTAVDAGNTTVLDGFTISGGHADGLASMRVQSSEIRVQRSEFGGQSLGFGLEILAEPTCDDLTNYGGGLCIQDGGLRLENLIFRDNYGEYGGAVYNYRGDTSFMNVTFLENTAWEGGGLSNYKGDLSFVGVVFRRNHANYGGGMFKDQGNLVFLNVIFEGNTSVSSGGGLSHIYDDLHMTNVVFSGNYTAGSGGGFFSAGGGPKGTLVNVTFCGNQAAERGGGANHVDGGDFDYFNVIMWDNQAPEGPHVHSEGATVEFSYSLVEEGCPEGASCSDMVSGAPLFMGEPDAGTDGDWGTADDDYGDLRLGVGSPAVDAGDNNVVPFDTYDLNEDGDTAELLPYDLAEQSRFVDIDTVADTGNGTAPIIDLGAYEQQAGMYQIYLPLVVR
jgi:hypothetical protein